MTHPYDDEPLYSEILPGLWMGGTHDLETVDFPKPLPRLDATPEFDAVLTMYAPAQPMGWFVQEHRYGIPDGPLDASTERGVLEEADWLYGQWSDGKRVLSRCQQGWNRSGLVVALMLLKAGYCPQEAVDLIRERRSPNALGNPDFVALIRTIGIGSSGDDIREDLADSDQL